MDGFVDGIDLNNNNARNGYRVECSNDPNKNHNDSDSNLCAQRIGLAVG